jgi:hypothetical protein
VGAITEADAEPNPDRKLPKVISPSDPCAAWTAKANKRVRRSSPHADRDSDC